ncbi:unnamed protein product [Albugo candida]|uniref:Uncharacterized protein n=1 Tax=Albugo candida TaxID=65357 RepID=A0A024GRF9_9STRA|nr:unnamed protein product [Albugo candida]|eukprot:CCI49478.1 unnamed protein product [Albugo candida]
MKYHYLKAYGLAGLGIFHADDRFVACQYVKMVPAFSTDDVNTRFGLEVRFTPPLSFDEKGSITDPKDSKTKSYLMNLIITNGLSTELHAKVLDTSKNIRYKTPMPGCHSTLKFWRNVYCAAWQRTAESLRKSIELKELYVSSVTSISPNYFISKNPGIYSFIRGENDGTQLFLGDKAKYERAILAPMRGITMVPAVRISLLGFIHDKQEVSFDFGTEATQVPRKVYDNIVNFNKNGGYEENCSKLAKSRHTLDIKLEIMYPAGYSHILNGNLKISGGDRCLVQSSTDEAKWVLGTSFATGHDIIIHTRKTSQSIIFTNVQDTEAHATIQSIQ